MNALFKKAATALVALCLSAPTANAATATTNLAVTAAVLDTCLVTSAGALTFGTLSTSAVSNETLPGNITIVCTATRTGLTVTLDGGANASGAQRYMSDGVSSTVPYNVFSDAAHSSGVAIDGLIYSGNITAAIPVLIPVYGQVPVGSYTAGLYTDTVLVTLVY